MQNELFHDFLLVALTCALVTAAFTDLRRRQIDNWLTGGIALAAPLWWAASGVSLWPGVAIQVAVALVAFIVLAGLFALRMMGGGDVKLLAALALWIEPEWFGRLVVIMALAGGVITLIFAVWHTIRRNRGRVAIPYGVAIAFAGVWVLGMRHWPGALHGSLVAG